MDGNPNMIAGNKKVNIPLGYMSRIIDINMFKRISVP